MHVVDAVEEAMLRFAARTGLTPSPGASGAAQTRYLWTDAFAVCAFIELHRATGDPQHLELARRLVDAVHRTLGRHRAGDARAGWISGLDEADGGLHPTRGGLRIGKPLDERARDEPFDDRLEWDRDGQYFHYLTKWIHALDCVARACGEARYRAWAVELAEAAHRAFVVRDRSGVATRMCWKMSVDLSRPLVRSMGHHDPLDGLATYAALQASIVAAGASAASDLDLAIAELASLCDGASWVTGDDLGIGCMLLSANDLTFATAHGGPAFPDLLETVLEDARRSLVASAASNRLNARPERRLAFRELGLAIGLRAIDAMRERIAAHPSRFGNGARLVTAMDALAQHAPMIGEIERFWRSPEHQRGPTWLDHRDINDVMLATSLAPATFLRRPAPTMRRGPDSAPSDDVDASHLGAF